jgi:predicted PurR-regulated permease PerM
MKPFVNIDTRTFVRFWLVVIGFIVAALLIFYARHALIIIGAALFIALALNLPVSRIARKLPGRSRVGATAIAYVAVLIVLGAVLTLVVPPIIQQTAKIIQNVPTIVDQASSQWDGAKGLITQYNLQPQVDSALQSLKDSTASWASNVGQTVISGIGSVFTFIASTFLVLVLAFLMLIEGPSWLKKLWSLYSSKERMELHKRALSRMYNVVSSYVIGQLTTALVGAICAGLAVTVIGLFVHEVSISLALPAAAIVFIFSLIPLFGSTISAVLVALLIALNSLPAAIAYAIYVIIYIQLEGNVISPRIQSRRLDLSALAVLGSLTIGLYLFGLIGGIIAIPIAGCIRVILDEYLEYRNKKRIKA